MARLHRPAGSIGATKCRTGSGPVQEGRGCTEVTRLKRHARGACGVGQATSLRRRTLGAPDARSVAKS
jgi:hypothetical protein